MSIRIYSQDSKFYMEDNGNTTELVELVDNGKTLKLPENSSNRRYCSVEKALKGITLDYKETKVFGPRENTKTKESAPKKSDAPKINELVEMLTEEERQVYRDLMNKAADRLSLKKKRERLDAMRKEMESLEKEINEGL